MEEEEKDDSAGQLQIRELRKDGDVESASHGEEKSAWEAVKLVVKGFLGNREEGNYEKLPGNLKANKNIGCDVSFKIDFLTHI